VTKLLTATAESKLKLFEILYARAQIGTDEEWERFDWLNRMFGPPETLMEELMEEVHNYQKEEWHEKPKRSEDRRFLHRGSLTQKPVTRQEDFGRTEIPEEIPLYQSDQDKEDLLFT
jgi:hypothetical protein